MKFKAHITIMLKKGVLDAQGAAVERTLKSQGYDDLKSARIGKAVEITLEAADAISAKKRAVDWAEKFIVNQVMETYTIKVEEAA